MNDVYAQSDEALIRQIGERLKELRLRQNLSQQQLADQAGLSRSAVSQAELGRAMTLTTLLQLLRALQEIELLSPFLEDLPPSPLLVLEQSRRKRKRGYTTGNSDPLQAQEPSPW